MRITRKTIYELRSEVENPDRLEPVLVSPQTLGVLLDAVEALDKISEITFGEIGPGIDIEFRNPSTTLEDL